MGGELIFIQNLNKIIENPAFQPKSLYINLPFKTLNTDSQWENEAGRELAS